jgi:fatty acid desaturase
VTDAALSPRERDLTWDETYRALAPFMRTDNRTNLLYLLWEYAVLALLLGMGVWLLAAWERDDLPTAAFVLASLVDAYAIGAMQHRLSALGHEACHYSFLRNKWANEVVSDFLCMFPVLAVTQQFRASHLKHHRFISDPERDPDLWRLNWIVPMRWPMSKLAFWKRYVFGTASPMVWVYILGQAKNANFGSKGMRNVYGPNAARVLMAGYWIALLTTVHLLGAWPVFLLFWFLPLSIFYPLLMQLREVAHHSNSATRGGPAGSRLFRANPLLNASVFPYGQDYHVTHHMFGVMPHFHLPAAHRVLMRYPPYREQLVVCWGYFFRRWGKPGPTVLDELARRRTATELAGVVR